MEDKQLKRRGRPKKDDGNTKSKQFRVRLTDVEYDKLRKRATERGESMSEFLIDCINGDVF